MLRHLQSLITVALFIAGSSCAVAQQADFNGLRRPGRLAGLELGQRIPDVAVFDGQGTAFSVGDLRNHYTVLVFGCLT